MLYTCCFLIIRSPQLAIAQEGSKSQLPKLTSWRFDGTAEGLPEFARIGGCTLPLVSTNGSLVNMLGHTLILNMSGL